MYYQKLNDIHCSVTSLRFLDKVIIKEQRQACSTWYYIHFFFYLFMKKSLITYYVPAPKGSEEILRRP